MWKQTETRFSFARVLLQRQPDRHGHVLLSGEDRQGHQRGSKYWALWCSDAARDGAPPLPPAPKENEEDRPNQI